MTEAQKDHQAWIMGRSETFLEPFFRENDPTLMDARLIEWAAVLMPLSASVIDAAMIEYHRHGPRSAKGKLIKPAAGDIYALGASMISPGRAPMQLDAASNFADRYKKGLGVPDFQFRDEALMAEILDRNLLTVEELKRHGAFIPARHEPAKTNERKESETNPNA